MKVILFQQDARDCLNKKEVWGFCKLFDTPKEALPPLSKYMLCLHLTSHDVMLRFPDELYVIVRHL